MTAQILGTYFFSHKSSPEARICCGLPRSKAPEFPQQLLQGPTWAFMAPSKRCYPSLMEDEKESSSKPKFYFWVIRPTTGNCKAFLGRLHGGGGGFPPYVRLGAQPVQCNFLYWDNPLFICMSASLVPTHRPPYHEPWLLHSDLVLLYFPGPPFLSP